MIKEKHHGVPLRVKTNGLVEFTEAGKVASLLHESGIDKVFSLLFRLCKFTQQSLTQLPLLNQHISQMAVALQSDNPAQYREFMQGDFAKVCGFMSACVETGLDVEGSAVARPEVTFYFLHRFWS